MEYEEDKAKIPVYRSIGPTYYTIFRVSNKKYKSMYMIRGYEKHMEREMDVPNANKEIENRILIGNSLIYKDVQEYLKNTKIYKNNVLARDILLTASPGFFENMPEPELNKWVDMNVEWLKDTFGDNCVYASLHIDEHTPHISALIVPKQYKQDKGYTLNNCRYFDGPVKLRNLQTSYANHMRSHFKELQRGIQKSKATHKDIQTFYSLLNSELSESDPLSVKSKALNASILQERLNALQSTLRLYKQYSDTLEYNKKELEKQNLIMLQKLKEIKQDKVIYEKVLKTISKSTGLEPETVARMINYIEKDVSKGNERKL